MSTFSILQISLDQTIGRDSFLEAAAGSVTRADLMQYHRDPHGIIASGIALEEADAVGAKLAALGFPVEIVADDEIPQLPDGFPIQRVDVEGGGLKFTDSMGRETVRAVTDLQFLAGGYIQRSRVKSENMVDHSGDWRSREWAPSTTDVVYKDKVEKEFRFDFFLLPEPHRLNLAPAPSKVVFVNGNALQPHKTAAIATAISQLAGLLPPERMSLGLRDPSRVYSSPRSYTQEILWHFRHLTKNS